MVAPAAYLEYGKINTERIKLESALRAKKTMIRQRRTSGKQPPSSTTGRCDLLAFADLPERSRNTVSPCDVGRLEESSGPSPLTDDNRGGKTSLDGASSSAAVSGK